MRRVGRVAWTWVALAGLSALIAGCNTPTSPTSSPGYLQTDLRVGVGAEAVNGSVVTVEYTGWFYDASQPDAKGVQFDTTTGRESFTFTVGAGQVIAGWERGVLGMRVGGMRRLIVPPSLAYGYNRIGLIPPTTTLVFDVELTGIAVE